MKNSFFRSTRFKWLLGLAIVFGPFVLVPQWHDWQLSRLQNAIETMKHPDNSRFMARYGEVNNFGNGNHIDFWAVELRSLSAMQKQMVLEDAYDEKRLPVPNDDYEQKNPDGTQEVSWQLLSSPLPKNYRVNMGNGTWNLARFAGVRDLYIVQIANFGENDNLNVFFDLRGQ